MYYTYNRLIYTYRLLQEVELDQLRVLIYKLPLSPAKNVRETDSEKGSVLT